ncbi:ribulose-bisphosphate carboxylase large subunit [Patescibacteria group bacterium]|nr:ribulose-bisphosphate carboxylase large subunit [Patescibacteria group bacterium]MBU1890637.1 ribulose-bisphosphate carboxylase large subunit [Patescibacteria group bacterium]
MSQIVDGYNYLHLGRSVKKSEHIIATFFIGSQMEINKAAQVVAGESSIGTWTDIKTLSKATFKKLSAKVIQADRRTRIVKIAYPLALFEPSNIAQLLSDVAGNIFSMKAIPNLRLIDLEFPDKYINSFLGPAFGADGVRHKLKVYKRPLIGAIMKPKLGLSWKQHAHFAYLAFKGGVDLVKDDENLTDQTFNPFDKRVRETVKLARKAEQETGQKKLCAFNISASANEMIKRAEFVKKAGGHCAMVDIMTVGFSGLQALRQARLGLILHGHRAMHSTMTRNPKHGISMTVIAKLARLAGIDQLHTGTVVGKMEGTARETNDINKFLSCKWGRIKPVMPIASGGLHPGLVPQLYKVIGPNVIINFGGGLHGHPKGTYQGAQAAFQAVEAVTKRIPLKKHAKSNIALAEAIIKWGAG